MRPFKLSYSISLLLLLIVMPMSVHADSLWTGSSFYSASSREIKVGDIITIQISESTSAVQEATTRTSKTSSLEADLLNDFDKITTALGNEQNRQEFETNASGQDDYRGTGQTTRRSQVRAVITAVVTEILDSGNLYVVGEHRVKVNNEVETIRIAGIVRPQDISARNTVFSYQLARAEVSVNGAGVVGQKQSPGVLTKAFNWLF